MPIHRASNHARDQQRWGRSDPPYTPHSVRRTTKRRFFVPFGRGPGPQVVRSFLPSVLSDQEQYALPPPPPRQPTQGTVFF